MKFIPKMQSTKQIFDNLVGIWSIKRVLGNYGTAEGTAKFTLQNQAPNKFENQTERRTNDVLVINYREDLQVKYLSDLGPNIENTAYKEYVYLYDKARDKIVKKFTNGNLFYELSIDFEKQTANGDHLCEKDMYKALYTFVNPQNFILTYFVNGPKKDYLIETAFTKQVTRS
ncbi:hypothetical protein HA402_000216 [Bradysia odoriphaga]|nr:hypothetical protein HA402_000216 [Bradysia odoriphaga]